MGYYCNPNGQKVVAQPATALYNGPPNPQQLRDLCISECWCVDVGPEIPAQVQAQRPQRCTIDNAAGVAAGPAGAAACEGTDFRDPAIKDNVYCDLFYGQPSVESCNAAHQLIGMEEKEPIDESREFLVQGVPPSFNGFKLERTPQYYPPDATGAHDCTIAIDMVDGTGNNPRYRANDLENWDYLWGRADAVIDKCVKGLGTGGWTSAGKLSQAPTTSKGPIADPIIGEQNNAMGVYVYGPLSQYAQFLAIKYACETDAEGSAQCDSDAPDPKRQKTGPGDVSSGAGTSSTAQSAPVAEGASCYKPSDCDAANNYICATDKSVPGDSTSWGTFTCRYFPNAASIVAAVATTIRVGSCRGRCLLGAGGTLEIPINGTVPMAAPAKILSHTIEASLSCPCNCTYVSHACCLSGDGIVAEDASQEIVTTQLPPNGTVCCDSTTGNWAVSGVQTDEVSKEDAICSAGSSVINSRSKISGRTGDIRAMKGRSLKLW
ncbi:MAG: hypothetical protein L6R39_005586 [Caloplaca ligustica]|nr:MAG: hypothetical protein L6R39_005586 [Caloplaca ligustica]